MDTGRDGPAWAFRLEGDEFLMVWTATGVTVRGGYEVYDEEFEDVERDKRREKKSS